MHIHPGLIKTDMTNVAAEALGEVDLPFDTVNLASHFIIWAASKDAAFAAGKFLMANWDIKDIKSLEPKIKENPQFLTHGLIW
jgi:hypothetical protein